MRYAKTLGTIILTGLAAPLCALAQAQAPAPLQPPAQAPATQCAPAYYRLADGSGVDIAPSDDSHYRWRRLDGTSGLLSRKPDGTWSSTLGWTGRDDGKTVDLSRCDRGEIRFAGMAGKHLSLATTEKRFVSGDAELAGRLILPPGRRAAPIVVLVHGSEDSSALRTYALQRILAAQGVGVFVYDKRGTGLSKGAFTHNIHQLATDAHAALETARSLAGARAGRIGYYGTSQGGWTAPLAATFGWADFVIAGYGLAVSPVDEDREALALDMSRHGFGAAETAKALEIGAAAQAIARSKFQSGYDALRLVVAKYRDEPWFRFVRGNITGIILQMPEATLREQGPRLFAGIIPDYDPMPVLRTLKTPQLWILGADDIDAPYLETYRRLIALKQAGHPLSIVVYPGVEHGLYAFETKGEERLSTRQPASLQRLLTDFARGERLADAYGDARVDR
ncbi:alpha/beta hydrolase family protein [Sphingomonas sp.]|uniref:alpha/beta hydrolase family protein n=1 Tax=Sphingomonas sp. TaxID=28214 RepID=UPI003D6C78B8